MRLSTIILFGGGYIADLFLTFAKNNSMGYKVLAIADNDKMVSLAP